MTNTIDLPPQPAPPRPQRPQPGTRPSPEKPAQPLPKPQPASPVDFSFGRTITTILGAGLVVATLFTFWSPNRLFTDDLLNELTSALQNDQPPAVNPVAPDETQPSLIGLIPGHWGYDVGYGPDPGAVCEFGQYAGVTEVEVNLRIAALVQKNLQEKGFRVELLEEDDERLEQYQAAMLISIHTDTCAYIDDNTTGFKLAASLTDPYPERTNRLKSCLIYHYGQTTQLPYHGGSSETLDMINYHVFNKTAFETPTLIIETGFMNLDADIVIRQPELAAKGISDGLLCYLRNEPVPENTLATAQP